MELGQIESYIDLQADLKRFKSHEIEQIKMIQLTHSLFYVNSDYFRKELNRICPLKEITVENTLCENVLIRIYFVK